MTTGSQRNLVVVVGPGRSGTSLATGLLGRLGYVVPQPEIKANESNPRGFGEPKWVVELHRQLLKDAKVGHGDARPGAAAIALAQIEGQGVQAEVAAWLGTQFDHGDNVVVKDPRLLWFPELWSRAAADVGARTVALVMLRHPVPVTKSNQTHYSDLPPATRVASWINCTLVTERNIRSMPRTSVGYDPLLQDWKQVLDLALEPVDLPAAASATPDQVAACDDLVDPDLRRSESSWAELGVSDHLESLAERVYEAMSSTVSPGVGSDAAHQQAMDALAAEYAALYENAEGVTRFSLNAARRAARGRGFREGQAEAAKAKAPQAAKAAKRAAEAAPPPAPPAPTRTPAMRVLARAVRRARRAARKLRQR